MHIHAIRRQYARMRTRNTHDLELYQMRVPDTAEPPSLTSHTDHMPPASLYGGHGVLFHHRQPPFRAMCSRIRSIADAERA